MTHQMAYIPLDYESKVKGKGEIDVLGSRIGIGGGSFLQQGLVLYFCAEAVIIVGAN